MADNPPKNTQNYPKTIQNLTAKRLNILGNEGTLMILPPLEKQRQLSEEEESLFPKLKHLAMRNKIRILEAKEAGNFEPQLQALFYSCAIGTGVVAYLTYQVLTDGGKQEANPEYVRWLKFGTPAAFALVFLVGLGLLLLLRRGDKGRATLQSISRWVAQAISLILILTLGLVLPTLAFYLFGGGRELLDSQNSLMKLGRALQLVFIFTASLLPALLYFLFDRQQLGTLRQRFEQQIFRLDPNVETLCDVQAKYGRQIDEIYGRETAGGEGRLARGTRWPILVATLVMTLGWMLTLLPSGPASDNIQPGQLLDFFLPQKSSVTFGFLGAYFFVLNTVLHRYVRADLKPKAYSSITVRILIVFILAWVVGAAFGTTTGALVGTFLIGVFPESGLTLIRESIRNQTGIGKLVALIGSRTKERFPLTELKELDVYDRARLLDEGVTNIEGLAHHDLIDLMLETRIPVPRLVDWIDQAVLYLHLQTDSSNDEESESENPQTPNRKVPETEGLRDLRAFLFDNSIRTATDFMATYQRRENSTLHSRATVDQQSRLLVLAEVLKDDEWLDHIRHWRASSRVMDEVLHACSEISVAKQEVEPVLLSPQIDESVVPMEVMESLGFSADPVSSGPNGGVQIPGKKEEPVP